VTTEPLEFWEILLYPVLCFITLAWLSHPFQWHFSSLLQWDIALFAAITIFEIYHNKGVRPGLARFMVIGLSVSIAQVLFTGQDHQLMYIIMLCFFGYIWFLENGIGWIVKTLQTFLQSRKTK
jgi:hypothetical protein